MGKSSLIYPFYVSAIIRSLLLSGYVIASIVILYKYYKSEKGKCSKKQFNWLSFLIANAILLAFCSFALTFNFYIDTIVQKTSINDYLFTIIAGITFTLIPSVLIFFPHVIYGVLDSELSEDAKGDKNTLNDKNLYLLAERIIECFENEQPYLDKSFSLDDLAIHLNVPKHQLYNCLNIQLYIIKV